MENTLEIRAIGGSTRMEMRDGRECFVFTPIVFNQRSQLLGNFFYEEIDPRALDGCDLSNVTGPFNHDDNVLLGRSTSGTLTWDINQDRVEAYIPYDSTDPDHQRVRAKVVRGDVNGASFAFITAQSGANWTEIAGTPYSLRRVVKMAVVADMSPVVNPAYLQTSAGMGKRSLEAIKAEHDQFVAEHRNQTPPATEGEPTTQNQDSSNADEVSPSVAAEHDRLAMELDL